MSEYFDYVPKTKVEKIKNQSDGKDYFVYNMSKGLDNYSQLKSQYSFQKNNFKTNGYSFCNTHMMGMGLIYLGYDKSNLCSERIKSMYPELTRLPDKLAKYALESEESNRFYKEKFPVMYAQFENGDKDATGANEIHQILSHDTNEFLGCGNVTYFSTNTSWLEIMNEIVYEKRPVGISGKFSGLNHIVLLVGCAYSELDNGDRPGLGQIPDYLIVDDPFGKTYEYSKGLSGNDVWIPFERCVSDFKDLGNPTFKFTHRFIRPSDLGLN